MRRRALGVSAWVTLIALCLEIARVPALAKAQSATASQPPPAEDPKLSEAVAATYTKRLAFRECRKRIVTQPDAS